jgi:3'(2'), 5'-bisphosphate nucleotidase
VDTQLVQAMLDVVDRAGRAVLASRARGILAVAKPDGSPVTAADLESEQVLVDGLKRLFPHIPVVSEERAARPAGAASSFLLIDPLDGTKEFIAGRGEFAVNVAIIKDEYPVLGAIGAPALGRLIVGISGVGMFERTSDGSLARFCPKPRREEAPLQILVSRSHLDRTTEQALSKLPRHAVRAMGSSLKFAMIASGEADLYIRLAPTMGWDTAAGQAIVEAAGGVVLAQDGSRLRYSLRAGLQNQGFVAATKLDDAQLVVGVSSASVTE